VEPSDLPRPVPADDWLASFRDEDAGMVQPGAKGPERAASGPSDDWLAPFQDVQAPPPPGLTGAVPIARQTSPKSSLGRSPVATPGENSFGGIFDDEQSSTPALADGEAHDNAIANGVRSRRRWLRRDIIVALGGGIALGVLAAVAASGRGSTTQLNSAPRETVSATTPAPAPASSLELVVSKGNDGQFKSIGEAIGSAAPGSRIRVVAGVYEETLTLDKNVDIVGEGKLEQVVIEAAGGPCIVMRAQAAMVRNLTMRSRAGHSPAEKGPAVELQSGRLTVDGCDLTSATQACLSVHGAKSNAVVTRCKIHDGADAGIAFMDKSTGSVDDCEIFGNSAAGVSILEDSRPTIRNCQIHHGKQSGILVARGGRGTIVDCEIVSNGVADVSIKEEGDPIFHGCTIRDGSGNGFWITDRGRGTMVRCEVFGHALPDVAIGNGGNATFHGCTIRDGKRCGVHIYGGGRGTLDTCQVLNSAVAGVLIEGESSAMVRSCTIRGGSGNGLSVVQKSSAEILMCEISGHAQPQIWIESGALPTIRKCKIHHGKAEGIAVTGRGRASVSDTDIFENAAAGVATSDGASSMIAGSRINRNGGAGVHALDGSIVDVSHCNVDDNRKGPWSIEPEAQVMGAQNSVPVPTGGFMTGPPAERDRREPPSTPSRSQTS
jgi:hypothetical protein